jgi:hypothetical protein
MTEFGPQMGYNLLTRNHENRIALYHRCAGDWDGIGTE